MIKAGELTIVADTRVGVGSGFGNYIRDIIQSQNHDFEPSDYMAILCRDDVMHLFEMLDEVLMRESASHIVQSLWGEDDTVFLGHIAGVPIYNMRACKQSAVHGPMGIFPFELALCASWEHAYGAQVAVDARAEFSSSIGTWAKKSIDAYLEQGVLDKLASNPANGIKLTPNTNV